MAVDRSAEAFDQFAAKLQEAPAATTEPVTHDQTPDPEPSQAPEPNPEAAAAPEEAAGEPSGEPEATEAEPAKTDAPRDEQGRFIRVGVHAKLMGEAQAAIKALQDQLEAAKGDQSPKTIEALEELKDQFPAELVDAVTGQFLALGAQNEKLVKQVEELLERDRAREQQEAAELSAQLRQDMSNVPQLMEWFEAANAENSTPEQQDLWQRVVEADAALKDTPAWKSRPVEQRFAKAVQRVCEDVGMDYKPPAQQSTNPTGTTAKPAGVAATRELPKAPDAPTSLSSMPAGGSPQTPKAVPAEGLSLHQSAKATEGMSLDQKMKFFFGAQ